MFCRKCGAECIEGAKFCPKCGTPLKAEADINEKDVNQKDISDASLSKEPEKSGNGKKRRPFWWILIIIVVAIVVVVLIILTRPGYNTTPEEESNLNNDGNVACIFDDFTDRSIIDDESAILAAQDAAEQLGYENAFDELSPYLYSQVDDECFYRLQQYYCEIPVYQSYTIVVASDEGDALSVYTEAKDIPENISITPTVTEEDVFESIVDYASQNWDNVYDDMVISELSPDSLIIYNLDESKPASLAYDLTVINDNFYNVIIDANTGEVLESHTALSNYEEHSVSDIPSSDYNYNIDNGLYVIANDEQNIQVFNMSGHSSEYFLELAQKYDESHYLNDILNFNSIVFSLPQATSENDVFGDTEDEEANDVNTAINFIINIEDVVKFYKNLDPDISFGDIWLFYNDSFDNGNNSTGGSIFNKSVVFLGSTYDGTENTLLAHELTHAVTALYGAGSGENTSPGIKEGLADVFAFFYVNDDWDMDLTKGGLTHRNAQNPSDYGYPESLNDEIAEADMPEDQEHTYATILSHAAWLMNESESISLSDLENVWYKTLDRLPSNVNYNVFSKALLETSIRYGFSYEQFQAVVNALNSVGMETEFPEIEEMKEEAFASEYVVAPGAKLVVKDENDNEYTDYYAVAKKDDSSYDISEGIVDLPEGNYSLILDVSQNNDTSDNTSNAFVTNEYTLQVEEGADDELIIIIPFNNNSQENLPSDASTENGADSNAPSVSSVQGLLELFPYMADELLYEYYIDFGIGYDLLKDGITSADQVYWLAAWAAFDASDFLNYTDGEQRESKYIDGVLYTILPTELYENRLRNMFGLEYDISDFIETPGQAIKDSDGAFCTLDGDYGVFDVEVTVENISETPDTDGTYTALAKYSDYDDSGSYNVYYMLYRLRPDESSDYGCVIVDMTPAGEGEADESLSMNDSNHLKEMFKAYYQKVLDYQDIYGENSIKDTGENINYIDGLAYVKLFDFNEDGQEELILGLPNFSSDNPDFRSTYYNIEVYGYVDDDIKMVYSGGIDYIDIFQIIKADDTYFIEVFSEDYDHSKVRPMEISLWSYDGTQFIESHFISQDSGNNGITYNIDGQAVSEDQWYAVLGEPVEDFSPRGMSADLENILEKNEETIEFLKDATS